MSKPQLFIISATDPCFSESNLWNVEQPPDFFYAYGHSASLSLLSQLPEKSLAIVGTRNPTARSVNRLKDWIQDLKGSGLVILSGFAKGVDAIAHESAIKTGLPTIAVLANGVDITYPRQNERLREDILASGGLFLSEFPPSTLPMPHYFLQRNRLIAGLSKAVWVVEAPQRSGALNTAYWARKREITVFATPCFPGDTMMAGNESLLNKHQAAPFWNIESLGEVWLDLATFLVKRKKKVKCSPDENDLITKVDEIMSEKGGAQVQELFDWAMKCSWSPQRFYDTLQKALDARFLLDENGLVLKNASLYR